MNRSIALFVGLVALLAHVLAIHNDGSGAIATVYDRAYAAARLARNLVHDGTLCWNVGGPAHESYPSLPWVLWIAIAERFHHIHKISVNQWSQLTGIFAALGTVIVVSRFHIERTASVIGSLMLVASGGIAAAAASGTETTTFALSITCTFLAFERGWPRRFAAFAVATVWIRPEGAWLVAVLFALNLVRRRHVDGAAPLPRVAYLAPALAAVAGTLLRWFTTGEILSPELAELLAPAPGQWHEGANYIRDFFVGTAVPFMLAVPLAYALRRKLSRSGRDALVLAVVWVALVLLRGGGSLPFSAMMVPALPLLFHAIQEGLTLALYSTRLQLRRLAIAGFVLALVLSGYASTFPSDRGPLPIGEWHYAWLRPKTRPRFAYEGALGRFGLAEEIRMTTRLRGLGIYLRDNAEAGTRVLTPWPGSIAYLSGLPVDDALGRATPAPGAHRTSTWTRPRRVDVLAWFETSPDLVVPHLWLANQISSREEIALSWVENMDSRVDEPGRVAQVTAALDAYELVTVPIYVWVTGPDELRGLSFQLLRRTELDLRPRITIELEPVTGDGARSFAVRATNPGQRQIADLRVEATDERGRTWYLRPTGTFDRERPLLARTRLLVYPGGGRPAELMRATVPDELGGARVTRVSAVLLNPHATDARRFWTVSDEAWVGL